MTTKYPITNTQLPRKRKIYVILTLLVLFVMVPIAAAHPLGNFTINRYSRLEPGVETFNLVYVLDMAEIPTFQERQLIDANEDEVISAAEMESYAQSKAIEIAGNLQLAINQKESNLNIQATDLTFPPGQGDLPTLHLKILYGVSLPEGELGGAFSVQYEDNNYAGRLGWQEIVVQPAGDVQLSFGEVATVDVSRELQQYPDDLLSQPLAVNRVEFGLDLAGMPAFTPSNITPTTLPTQTTTTRFSQDNFADLLNATLDTPQAVLFALLVAFGLGAAHALTPGHGKTIVGAYLVGSRGTPYHALFLGLTTTITHTVGVFIFGLLVYFASQYILPEQLFPWLGALSGGLVVVIGFSLLRGHWHTWRKQIKTPHSAITDVHSHFGIEHSHTAGNAGTGWRNLLALGVSGGLLPCPSALIVLLSAIALGRVGLGLLLIVVFSVGLAAVLTAIGLILVYAGRLVERSPLSLGRMAKVMPALSAAFITIAGIIITWQALLQT